MKKVFNCVRDSSKLPCSADSQTPIEIGGTPKKKKTALTGGNFWEGAVTGFVVSAANHALHGDPIDPKKKKAGAETSGDTRKYLYGSSEQSALEDFLFGPSYVQGGGGAMELLALGPVKGANWLLKLFAARRGTTVLGKYPQYIKLAGKLNARRFNIPTSVWNKMTPAEQWIANVKFLDRTIARGDNIILANQVKDISKVSGYFRKELDYLIGKGYRLNKNGTQLIR